MAVVGGGDSALDAALMVLARGGLVDLIVREATPIGKADSLSQIREAGGHIHTSTEISAARFAGDEIELELTGGERLSCSLAIVQIGFLSAKETFERLALVLNDDGSIAVDPYFETSRQGIFAVGDVHGDIKLIAVAWAEGIQAAIHAFKEITSPYWLNEKRLKDHKIALIGEKIARAASSTCARPSSKSKAERLDCSLAHSLMPHVLIIGGGFAGLNAAKGLAGEGIDVTLVDRTNHHLFQPLLYQVAMAGLSPADIAAPIRSMLSNYRNIRVLQGEIRSLDLERKRGGRRFRRADVRLSHSGLRRTAQLLRPRRVGGIRPGTEEPGTGHRNPPPRALGL